MTLELKIKIPVPATQQVFNREVLVEYSCGSNLSISTELATMLTQAALAAARVAYNRADPATDTQPLADCAASLHRETPHPEPILATNNIPGVTDGDQVQVHDAEP